MKYSVLVLIYVLTSCLHRADKISSEQGIVVAKQFVPDQSHYYTTMHPQWDGKNNYYTPETHYEHIPEKFLIVFKCAHGIVFTIDRQDLFLKLNQSDTVQIDYYEMLNKKGEVKDFDFVDANKTTSKNW